MAKKKTPKVDPLALAIHELARSINRLASVEESKRPHLGSGGVSTYSGGGGYYPGASGGGAGGSGGGSAGSPAIVRTINSGSGGAGAVAQIPA